MYKPKLTLQEELGILEKAIKDNQKEMAERMLNDCQDLLEIAKPLL